MDEKAPLPDEVEELDRLRFQVLMEKHGRLTAELQNLQMKLAETQQKLRQYESALAKKYSIGREDQVDLETGRISRHGGVIG